MLPHMSRAGSQTTKKASLSSSSPAKEVKASAKDADWVNVTDPEERRRIQNRIAQRKFREKTRENKEKAERDSRNAEHAGNSYRIPSSFDIIGDSSLSGLPWGSVNLGHVISRGHEAESKRSSGRNTCAGDDSSNPSSNNYCISSQDQVIRKSMRYSGNDGEVQIMEDSPYLYGIGSPPMPQFTLQ